MHIEQPPLLGHTLSSRIDMSRRHCVTNKSDSELLRPEADAVPLVSDQTGGPVLAAGQDTGCTQR